MKKIFLIIAVLAISTGSFAQLVVTLVMNATPPGTLIDWGTKKETLTYLIVNQSGAVRRAVIKAELKTTDGTLAGFYQSCCSKDHYSRERNNDFISRRCNSSGDNGVQWKI